PNTRRVLQRLERRVFVCAIEPDQRGYGAVIHGGLLPALQIGQQLVGPDAALKGHIVIGHVSIEGTQRQALGGLAGCPGGVPVMGSSPIRSRPALIARAILSSFSHGSSPLRL